MTTERVHFSPLEIRLGQGDLINNDVFIQFTSSDLDFLRAVKKQFNLGKLPYETLRLNEREEVGKTIYVLR